MSIARAVEDAAGAAIDVDAALATEVARTGDEVALDRELAATEAPSLALAGNSGEAPRASDIPPQVAADRIAEIAMVTSGLEASALGPTFLSVDCHGPPREDT